MPKVNGKEFAYTDAGKAKAKVAEKKAAAKPKAKAKKGR